MQKFFSLICVLLLPVMPFKLTMFRYDCKLRKRLFLNQQDRQKALSQLLCSELATIYVETFGSFVLPGSFLADITTVLTSKTVPLGKICRGIKTYSTNVFFNLMRSPST